ncbi:P-loop containing nucleoside triphosphate hydrolase protein [Globomyces pollinis-pini]|nr:P-loop containing nucleoside triphosphate hydrolase protein [Globomyces pollinis-pini]
MNVLGTILFLRFRFLGPNGCGKTSTIKSLLGMIKPTSGHIRLGDYDLLPFYPDEVRKDLGICPQFDCLFPLLTPWEHFELFASIRGCDPTDPLVSNELHSILNDVGLVEFKDQSVKLLSGGTKRKVSLATALIGKPKIIFLDEPTTGIDVHIRKSIWDIIKRMKETTSIILTTHSMEEAEALSDRIGIVINGTLKCLGSPARLKSVYGSGYQLTVNCSENREHFQNYFFERAGKDDWEIERQIGSLMIFQLTAKGKQNYQSRIASSANDHEKTLKAIQFISNLFNILETSELSELYGLFSFEIGETTLAQVFIEMEKQQVQHSI